MFIGEKCTTKNQNKATICKNVLFDSALLQQIVKWENAVAPVILLLQEMHLLQKIAPWIANVAFLSHEKYPRVNFIHFQKIKKFLSNEVDDKNYTGNVTLIPWFAY